MRKEQFISVDDDDGEKICTQGVGENSI